LSQYGVSGSDYAESIEFIGTTFTGDGAESNTTNETTPQYIGVGFIQSANIVESDYAGGYADLDGFDGFNPDTGSNDSSSFSNSAGTYTLNNFDPELLTSLTFYA
jgi:hypothetical protein